MKQIVNNDVSKDSPIASITLHDPFLFVVKFFLTFLFQHFEKV